MEEKFQAAKNYIAENKQNILNSFFEILEIQTISSDPAYKQHLKNGAEWIENYLQKIGISKTR
jgi:acetylornithine deacetylase/succinyl-diaminopimelate desuccinylase-like protein